MQVSKLAAGLLGECKIMVLERNIATFLDEVLQMSMDQSDLKLALLIAQARERAGNLALVAEAGESIGADQAKEDEDVLVPVKTAVP